MRKLRPLNRGRLQAVLGAVLGAALMCIGLAVSWAHHGRHCSSEQPVALAKCACSREESGAAAAAAAGDGSAPDPSLPLLGELLARIPRDLQPFAESGITLDMVEQAYCTSLLPYQNQMGAGGFRFQVIGGRMYVAGMAEEFHTRLHGLQRQLLEVGRRWRLADVDVIIDGGDSPTQGGTSSECPVRGPVVTLSRRSGDPAHAHALLAPTWTFAEWMETRTLSWREQLAIADSAQEAFPWRERDERLLFRGSMPPMNAEFRWGVGDSIWRWWLAHNASLAVSPFDTLIEQHITLHDSRFKTLFQHCSYRYLLHLDGVTNSDRIKYLLACGSAVIWLREAPAAGGAAAAPGLAMTAGSAGWKAARAEAMSSAALGGTPAAAAGGAGGKAAQPDAAGGADGAPAMRSGVYEEFWYHLLKNGTHLLVLEVPRNGSGAADALLAAMERLKENDGMARALGRAARQLATTALSPDALQCYWKELLTSYARLQRFKPALHPDAAPLEEVLLSRRSIAWGERTCKRCPLTLGRRVP